MARLRGVAIILTKNNLQLLMF